MRKIAEEDTEFGQRIRMRIHTGVLVEDEMVAGIIKKRLSDDDCKNGYVIDVYPRTEKQLELFDPQFGKVFYIEISDNEVVERLLKRGREDDSTEIIKTRLKVYHQQTQPLLDYYQRQGILVKIPGEGSIEEVQQQIREYLKSETAE